MNEGTSHRKKTAAKGKAAAKDSSPKKSAARKLFSMDQFDHLFAEQAERNARIDPGKLIHISLTR